MIISQKIGRNLTQEIRGLAADFAQQSEVVAVYLFGSYASGCISHLSDVDIAILFSHHLSKEAMSETYDDYYHLICQRLKTNEVDLLILNEVPLSFAYEIIKEGKIIYVRDENELKDFQERVTRHYLDTAFLRKEHQFHLRARLENREFGQ